MRRVDGWTAESLHLWLPPSVLLVWDGAAETARRPVSSAMRRRAEDTAGAEAEHKGIRPRAAVKHAIVLAVPITPQVPDCVSLVNGKVLSTEI